MADLEMAFTEWETRDDAMKMPSSISVLGWIDLADREAIGQPTSPNQP